MKASVGMRKIAVVVVVLLSSLRRALLYIRRGNKNETPPGGFHPLAKVSLLGSHGQPIGGTRLHQPACRFRRRATLARTDATPLSLAPFYRELMRPVKPRSGSHTTFAKAVLAAIRTFEPELTEDCHSGTSSGSTPARGAKAPLGVILLAQGVANQPCRFSSGHQRRKSIARLQRPTKSHSLLIATSTG